MAGKSAGIAEASSRKKLNMRILLTGFGGFPGAAVNPTQAIVCAIARTPALRRAGLDIRAAVLPVEYARVEAELARLLAQTRPDAVLHLGLAGRRKSMSIETRARNRMNIIHPDAAGRFAPALRLTLAGGEGRAARYDALAIRRAMRATRVPAALSIDAGDYLCNQALWITLGQFSGPAGFIHVPSPMRLTRPRDVDRSSADKGKRPALSLMVRAVEAALRELARQARFVRRRR
ncbi:MAG: pyroglutamyl-peptidase I [Alphaproteobacteria bacterium]|nr:pyroglutamyl-peptidase I [Alphaproteobacteria bacterium]